MNDLFTLHFVQQILYVNYLVVHVLNEVVSQCIAGSTMFLYYIVYWLILKN